MINLNRHVCKTLFQLYLEVAYSPCPFPASFRSSNGANVSEALGCIRVHHSLLSTPPQRRLHGCVDAHSAVAHPRVCFVDPMLNSTRTRLCLNSSDNLVTKLLWSQGGPCQGKGKIWTQRGKGEYLADMQAQMSMSMRRPLLACYHPTKADKASKPCGSRSDRNYESESGPVFCQTQPVEERSYVQGHCAAIRLIKSISRLAD